MTRRPALFGLLAGMFLAAGLVLSALVLARAWLRIAETQVVTVSGSARRDVESDLAAFSATFSVEAPTLLEAQRQMATSRAAVEDFLAKRGAPAAVFTAVSIQEVRSRKQDPYDANSGLLAGFRLAQGVGFSSTNITLVETLCRENTELIEAGVLFTPSAPSFLYTKAGEAKIEMLSEATADARRRAGHIAKQGGRELGDLRSARMGVFQINAQHSSETSWEGNNDLSSRVKTIHSVVNATFALR